MDIIHHNIWVKGRVQGVWFRKFTKDEALRLGLKGFVKNESNGNVYIEVEGNKTDLFKFYEWLHSGSPKSEVKENIQGFKSFIISR
ncbi:MAG: acylphosphatase [Flavobacteriaceae bacterium]|nr:acylphosphatase [Flavobacteriaceae bacterium]